MCPVRLSTNASRRATGGRSRDARAERNIVEVSLQREISWWSCSLGSTFGIGLVREHGVVGGQSAADVLRAGESVGRRWLQCALHRSRCTQAAHRPGALMTADVPPTVTMRASQEQLLLSIRTFDKAGHAC